MKRRVLRAHANKRRLRILSAEHGLCLDSYNILCDASFLRAVGHAICNNNFSMGGGGGGGTSSGINNNINNNNKNNNNNNNKNGISEMHEPPVRTLKALMHETFAAAASQTTQSDSEPAEKSKQQKGINLSLYYLPETATALRRMVQREEKNDVEKVTNRGSKGHGKNISSASHAGGGIKKCGLGAVAEALLKGLMCVGYQNRETTSTAEVSSESGGRNEGKAVTQFITEVASGKPHGYSVHGGKNANFFFVATQSHDVRRLLPADSALIRLTTMPTALWIERNGDSFNYEGSGKMNNRNANSSNYNHNKSYGSSGSGDVHNDFHCGGVRVGGHKGLSEADIAFMRHLSANLVPGAEPPLKRARGFDNIKSVTDGIPRVAKGKSQRDAAVTSRSGDSSVSAFVKHSSRRKARGPNPLSVKKKRKREVLRVDVSASQRKKERKE
ncbi:hypothetical protein, conserved [Trypanosoma brucei gambiense DAL972]|uniref:UTP23 sensor motif region domain-containing protein n=1 Tax=Trypanosoma brucei gambiense (strain MHOM/CI/86/DAL972) TaxID=679716 RepID=C9ZIQ9_TRYB9|nr:hypothetical protein, conserved [Trypanosoma brucei gambiense DAL972]CBH09051.1 hypothetical protein, conserved [Trypanosoma brucei gambiense DAL972]|eukprot:XP_011771492.1 hypothetical protein, conserved [Trypanosoma brucei gambiense DAL972]